MELDSEGNSPVATVNNAPNKLITAAALLNVNKCKLHWAVFSSFML